MRDPALPITPAFKNACTPFASRNLCQGKIMAMTMMICFMMLIIHAFVIKAHLDWDYLGNNTCNQDVQSTRPQIITTMMIPAWIKCNNKDFPSQLTCSFGPWWSFTPDCAFQESASSWARGNACKCFWNSLIVADNMRCLSRFFFLYEFNMMLQSKLNLWRKKNT